MPSVAVSNSMFDQSVLHRREKLAGKSGLVGLLKDAHAFRITLFASIGGLLYGYNQGMFGGLLAMSSFQARMGEAVTDPTRKGWLASILELGAWFGALYAGFLADVMSRKYAIIFNTCIFIIGVVVQCTAVSGGAPAILGGRFIVGVGVGANSMLVPMYNAEVAPPEIRGSLVALNNAAIGFGIMISYWIDYGCNYIGGTGATQSNAAWIIPVALQVPAGLILIVGMIFMPFSPRWLMMRGHEKETRAVLAKLRRLPEDDEVIELEYLEIQAQCRFEKATITEKHPHLESRTNTNLIKLQCMAFASLFQTKAMFRRVIVTTVIQTFTQWVGVDAVLYYAPSMFVGLGISSNTTSLLATGVVGILIFLGTILAVLYIDRLGRKLVLILGAIGMAASLIVAAVIVKTCSHDWPAHRAAGWGGVCMIWFYIFNFGYSWGPVAFVVSAEIWPMSTRAVGIALALSANWMANFVVGQVTPDMLQSLGWGTYLFFGIMSCLAGAFVWLFVPETKRLTLEEMDIVFGSEGTTQADVERMHRIHVEIGLYDLLHRPDAGDNEKSYQGEKSPAVTEHVEE